MLTTPIVHREIIEEHLHKGMYVFVENFCDDALECYKRCFEPDHHHYGHEYAQSDTNTIFS